jgi:branched-chain amino acid transport system permease protein
VLGTLLAWPLRHLGGLHYAIATLALAELVRLALSAFTWRFRTADGRLAGPDGVEGFRDIRWLFEHEVGQELFLGFAASLLLLAIVMLLQLERTRLGLALRALGLDAPLASASALPVPALRLFSHTVSGALAALAGGLYAHQVTYLEPAIFDAMLGIHAVGYAMIGGLATPLGPLLGAGLDLGLLEATRLFEGWRMVLFGGLVALFLRWRPRGLLDESLLHRLHSFFKTQR